MRDRIRTALVLTFSAAAAALLPAAAAHAADGSGTVGALPTAGVGDLLPTDAVPTSALDDALPTQSVTDALGSGIGPVKHLTLDPLSNTGVDPLDNAVGGQIADFKPVSTAIATDPVTSGGSLSTLPVVGAAAGLLPG
ncbi:hypothetical protein V2S66_06785 [Streptomyces sp. V4-01]|uniref:ATP-binding protein n=1 Tax=Actinacidiphila polyblastidii TaxID=3110430 RepID=A0ABU7P796_9ACTN|nr:hypothetical protein [Streptomyces sp. V4-01]